MESQDYIKNKLEVFIKEFAKTRVRYEYNEMALVHIIEILPNEVYHLDDAYISWERNMFDEFIGLYPTENLCFISNDALVSIENAIYIKEGLDYELFSTINAIVSFDENKIFVTQSVTDFEDDITFSHKHNEDKQVPKCYSSDFYSFILAA